MITKRTCGLPLICLVCGDTARGINFNVMSCMSCKTFFRRHATKLHINLKCLRSNNCEINIHTRGDCSACRLDKCLTLGMNPKLIGKRFDHRDKYCSNYYPKAKHQSKQLDTLSLLEHDRSILSKDEWRLLSNLVHTYDRLDMISYTKQFLVYQSSLPVKLRLKSTSMIDFLKYLYSTYQSFVEHTPYYHLLPINTRKELFVHNSEMFGTFNSMFVIRETHAMDYTAFRTGADSIYTPNGVHGFNAFVSQLDPNNVLVRAMLSILAFSPNCSTVYFDESVDLNLEFDSILIFNIESIFVTMLWKYLIYQYGLVDAIHWFNHFIKYVVNLIRFVYEQRGNQHTAMLDTVIEDTSRLLCLDD